MITYLRNSEEMKAVINLGRLIFYLIIYVHCAGCLWWFVAPIDHSRRWIPPQHYKEREDWFLTYEQDFTY
jgi:hypothetical protein